MNVKERLKEYIKYKNLTVISFERSILNESDKFLTSEQRFPIESVV